MNTGGDRTGTLSAWIRWLLFAEGLVLLLALAGPGYRYAVHREGDHALLARMVMEDPGYLDAVLVNFVAVNLFIMAVWLLAWIVTRLRGNT
jgi:hypothetical protein